LFIYYRTTLEQLDDLVTTHQFVAMMVVITLALYLYVTSGIDIELE
jgi:hypothetical protein